MTTGQMAISGADLLAKVGRVKCEVTIMRKQSNEAKECAILDILSDELIKFGPNQII